MPSSRKSDRVELSPELVERVLSKLGLPKRPDPDRAGLRAIYAAWCQRVPFDNVRKMIHLREEIAGPLPGDDANDFFAAWLAHGTGGTCWAGNGALHSLLRALGFETRRGYGTMLVSADIPPNHGTVIVTIDGEDELADASILFGEPLPIRDGARIDHPAWGVTLYRDDDGRLRVAWRPFHMLLDLRIESTDAGRDDFRRFHEVTRGWSPFNFSLSARLNTADTVIGASFGQLAEIDAASSLELVEKPTPEERVAFLVDGLGLSEEIASRLPEDQPLPPAPARD
jgi:arylamine N-acetyltransferase